MIGRARGAPRPTVARGWSAGAGQRPLRLPSNIPGVLQHSRGWFSRSPLRARGARSQRRAAKRVRVLVGFAEQDERRPVVRVLERPGRLRPVAADALALGTTV